MKKVLPLYNSEKGTPFLHIKFKWKHTIMIANKGIVVKYFEVYRPNDINNINDLVSYLQIK